MEQITEQIGYQSRTPEQNGAEYYVKLAGGIPFMIPFGILTSAELRAIAEHQEALIAERAELTPRSVAALNWVNPMDPANYDMTGMRDWVAKRLAANAAFADSKAGRRWRSALSSNDRNFLLVVGPKVRDAFFNDPNAPSPTALADIPAPERDSATAPTERFTPKSDLGPALSP